LKYIFLILSIFIFNSLGAQDFPKLYKWYYRDNGFPFGIEHLTLSSDGIFFYTVSSESGKCFLAKGTWKQKGNKLYLIGFDSTLAYPKPKVEFVKGSDSLLVITALDYFNKPFDGLTIGLLTPDTKNLYDGEYTFADSLGKFKVDKTKYSGFFFIYQWYNSDASLYDTTIQSYKITKDINGINVYLPIASAGALDRGISLINFGAQTFKIRDKGLRRKRELVYKPWDK
jgi:hypothetical protein